MNDDEMRTSTFQQYYIVNLTLILHKHKLSQSSSSSHCRRLIVVVSSLSCIVLQGALKNNSRRFEIFPLKNRPWFNQNFPLNSIHDELHTKQHYFTVLPKIPNETTEWPVSMGRIQFKSTKPTAMTVMNLTYKYNCCTKRINSKHSPKFDS